MHIGDYLRNVYYHHNSVVNSTLVVNATMLTSFLIKVKLSLCNFIRLYIQNIKKSKRRCAHGVCRSSAGKEDRERFDRSVAVMADIVASVLAKLKNKAKASGISYQQCLQLFFQEEFLRRLAGSKYAENFVLKGGLGNRYM